MTVLESPETAAEVVVVEEEDRDYEVEDGDRKVVRRRGRNGRLELLETVSFQAAETAEVVVVTEEDQNCAVARRNERLESPEMVAEDRNYAAARRRESNGRLELSEMAEAERRRERNGRLESPVAEADGRNRRLDSPETVSSQAAEMVAEDRNHASLRRRERNGRLESPEVAETVAEAETKTEKKEIGERSGREAVEVKYAYRASAPAHRRIKESPLSSDAIFKQVCFT